MYKVEDLVIGDVVAFDGRGVKLESIDIAGGGYRRLKFEGYESQVFSRQVEFRLVTENTGIVESPMQLAQSINAVDVESLTNEAHTADLVVLEHSLRGLMLKVRDVRSDRLKAESEEL